MSGAAPLSAPGGPGAAPSAADGAEATQEVYDMQGALGSTAAGPPAGASEAPASAPRIKREQPQSPDGSAGGTEPIAGQWPPPGVKRPKLEHGADEDDDDAAASALPYVPPAAAAQSTPQLPYVVPPLPPLLPRYGAGLGSSRAERSQNFRQSGVDNPPHVRCGRAPPPEVARHKIHANLSVAFRHPYAPTPPQMQVMTTLADALYSRVHCVVEAPTGTGKTAAVFTPLLAFQAQLFKQFGGTDPGLVPRIIYVARTHPQLDNTAAELATYCYETTISAPVAKEHLCMLPRVEGLSRADQCRAACRPLSAEQQQMLPGRRTGCEYLDTQNASDMPASRIDEYISGGPLAATSIEDMVAKSRAAGVCAHHTSRDLVQTNGANVLLLSYLQLLDLHLRACNQTNALLKGALVFVDESHNVPGVCRDVASESLTAAQLLAQRNECEAQLRALHDLLRLLSTPGIRPQDERMKPLLVEASMSTLLVVQRFTGHLMRWMDVQTGSSPCVKLEWQTDELTQSAQLPGESAQDLIVAALLACGAMRDPMAAAAAAAAAAASPAAAAAPTLALPGSPAATGAPSAAGFASPAAAPSPAPSPARSPAGARAARQARVWAAHEALMELAKELNVVDAALKEAGYRTTAAGSHNRSPTGRVGSLISKLAMCVGASAECYALVLRRLSPKGVQEERVKPAKLARSPLPQLDIVCLTATVAMRSVLKLARCVVFASGTLGPEADFACEVGLHNYRAVSTEHHATVKTQLLPLVYLGRPGRLLRLTSAALKASANAAPGTSLIDEAGDVLLRCAPHVGGGILVFFSSKGACRQITGQWRRDGTLVRLESLLPDRAALVIDDADTAEESVANIERYCHFARMASANGLPTAIMFAPLRGRASEGSDFKDGLARCVFILSLPLPPCKDPVIVAKMAYNDRVGPPLPNGERWYKSEAVRCAAQAVGRVIRHAGDHGAAVLLDCRYAPGRPDSVHAQLPRYLKGLLQTDTDAATLAAKLPPFFARCAALTAAAPAAPAAGPSAAGGVKDE